MPVPTSEELRAMGTAALLMNFRDACNREGKLQQKQTFAALFGIEYTVPVEATKTVEAYFGEVYTRLMTR